VHACQQRYTDTIMQQPLVISADKGINLTVTILCCFYVVRWSSDRRNSEHTREDAKTGHFQDITVTLLGRSNTVKSDCQ